VKVIILVCCYYLILGRKIYLGKKQAKRKRFLKRMKSRGKWKHGRSNVEKVRRLEEARALARARANTNTQPSRDRFTLQHFNIETQEDNSLEILKKYLET
jgi:hypothetical protein